MRASVAGIITARGGSKGIPKKNITPLAGKPLIAWTIESAVQSPYLTRLIVSTDDPEIAEVAKQWGAGAPFLRPANLAQDDSPHVPVVIHAVEWLKLHEDIDFDYVLLLQPTSPLRSTTDIDNAVRLALDKDAESVVSVCESFSHPYLAKRVTSEGRLEDFVPRHDGYLRRQDLPPAFTLNGAIYLVRSEILFDKHTLFPERTYAYLMPQERSLDIDTPWHLYLTDLILRNKNESKND
jgi:N-acylneuraminate cytidylyltransferase/CMP-N,N'-diacetyllegionaminic acid synthase